MPFPEHDSMSSAGQTEEDQEDANDYPRLEVKEPMYFAHLPIRGQQTLCDRESLTENCEEDGLESNQGRNCGKEECVDVQSDAAHTSGVWY